MSQNTSRRKLTPRDHLRVAFSRDRQQHAEHAAALQQQLTQDHQREVATRQREAAVRQRITDGLQAQTTLEQQMWTLAHRLAELDGHVIRDALDHDDALDVLQAQLLTTVQELTKQQRFSDALSQQQLTTERQQKQFATDEQRIQQQLIAALTKLSAPKKVTIQRNARGKITSAEVG